MTREPITMPCEGSRQDGHNFGLLGEVLCKMCGRIVDADYDVAVDHDRPDIMAMLDRGDYR